MNSESDRLEVIETEPCLTGGCLCGGVRFELAEPPRVAGYCHCTRCQRRTGTGSSAGARIDGRTLTLLAGEELVHGWRPPGGGFEKCFCRVCGGHLFSRNPDDPTQIAIRMGAFDGDPGVRPSFRMFVSSAAAWEPLPDDGLPRHEGRAPG
ncbi:MAG: GFA family protein [Solirubrobacteraceae bacterium]